MKIKDYLEERAFLLVVNFTIIFIICILLYSSNVRSYAVFMVFILYMISIISVYGYEYIKKKRCSKDVFKTLDALEEKYLLSEVIGEPEEAEYKDFYEILRQCCKSMNDEITSINNREKEFREFIELWVHEVKTPIASSKLTIENNRNNVTESLEEDIIKVEHYIEQALFYARSGSVNKDFLIRELNLNRVVNESIRKYSKLLIKNRVRINKENLDVSIYSDDKWLVFIFGQIISNSIKYYDKEEKYLEFKAVENKDSIIFTIADNGTGIEDKYLNKIFEKGFTGDNGRSEKEATGIGLYLCKKLSEKLHIKIKAESEMGQGTTIVLTFPKSSQYFLK